MSRPWAAIRRCGRRCSGGCTRERCHPRALVNPTAHRCRR
jgi:hypothetical protein